MAGRDVGGSAIGRSTTALSSWASGRSTTSTTRQVPGVGVFPGSVQASGERLSVSQAYLDAEVRARANLTVRCEAPVARVLLEDGRVVGVELRSGEVIEAGEVILCAGAIESPKLLLLSGIGPAGDLRALNIDPVLDLPGVGANLQDHVGLGCIYHRPEAEHARRFAGQDRARRRHRQGTRRRLPRAGVPDLVVGGRRHLVPGVRVPPPAAVARPAHAGVGRPRRHPRARPAAARRRRSR
ncbi:MAG: GMC family oxidoreductase N-terminal domain-containing protein [Acidimicrobiales bacterium]